MKYNLRFVTFKADTKVDEGFSIHHQNRAHVIFHEINGQPTSWFCNTLIKAYKKIYVNGTELII